MTCFSVKGGLIPDIPAYLQQYEMYILKNKKS